MSSDNKTVTLAIHTYRRAIELQVRLKAEGVSSELRPVQTDRSGPEPGVRVCVQISDLAKALRIVETEADRELVALSARLAGMSPTLLIPVDFSSHSKLAVEVGFDLAARLHLTPVLLHAFVTPYFQGQIDAENPDNGIEEMDNAQLELNLEQQATVELDRLKSNIRRRILDGTLPKLEFKSELREGVPEEVILQYSRKTPPSFIVMATRGASRRSRELIGSVTAEVLDSCRVPLFIVPENKTMPAIRDINKVVFFCNLDQQDILAMDTFQRMFSYPDDAEIYLVSVNPRATVVAKKLDGLKHYFTENYPTSVFHALPLNIAGDFRGDFEKVMERHQIQLLVVPNRRRNIFQRLFNPSVAHRLLFEKDVPMLALPF